MSSCIRAATSDDLERIASIENEADALLIEFLGPGEWHPAPTGLERAASPGFILVASASSGGVAVGFAHVLETDGYAHLEQLSVATGHARQGHGRALVEAAIVEAKARGHDRISLRTFAEVPWNAPFYKTCGFSESEPVSIFHRRAAEAEILLGMGRYGCRIQMTARLA